MKRPRVIQVIESTELRGNGSEQDPFVEVVQYHTLEGEFLAENNPHDPQPSSKRGRG